MTESPPPAEPSEPLIPHPFKLELSDEEVRDFQQIMREESDTELSFPEAKERALELLRLFLLFMDPKGYEAASRKEPPRSHGRQDREGCRRHPRRRRRSSGAWKIWRNSFNS